MNRVQESRLAWENAVKAAKARGSRSKGLQIWPGDRDRIRLKDLPVLPEGWAANLKGRSWEIITVANDRELREAVKPGRSYGLGVAISDPTGHYMVIEQG